MARSAAGMVTLMFVWRCFAPVSLFLFYFKCMDVLSAHPSVHHVYAVSEEASRGSVLLRRATGSSEPLWC